MLIRNGHTNVMSYRVNFFITCLEELVDSQEELIKFNSMAHRISRLEQQDYDKIFKDKPKIDEIDHEAQIKQMMEG
jgi:ABC-type uncharacterized transport system permease subunit